MILLNTGSSKVAIFGLLVAIGVASCNTKSDEKSKLIVKKWAYKEFKVNDEVMSGDQLENPVMEFFDDGKYKFVFGEMTEEGVWKIEGDALVTTTNDNKTNSLKIMKLVSDTLVLYSDADGVKAFITLAPYSTEESKQ